MSNFTDTATLLLQNEQDYIDRFTADKELWNSIKTIQNYDKNNPYDEKNYENSNVNTQNGYIGGALGGIFPSTIESFFIGDPDDPVPPISVYIFLQQKLTYVRNCNLDFSIKAISGITGIEEWKLRRYISSKELKAYSKNQNADNPGRTGYYVKKEDLITFIKTKAREIVNKYAADMKQIMKTEICNINNFLKTTCELISLGEIEIKIDELKKTDELTLLEKKFLLQSLKVEKTLLESIKVFFEKNDKV